MMKLTLISMLGYINVINSLNDEICGTISENILYAGQTINSGSINIYNTRTELCVEYQTTQPWYLIETHLHLANSEENIPQNRKGNPKIGNFDYGNNELPNGETDIKYCFNLDNNQHFFDNQCTYIGAHAVVGSDLDGDYIADNMETAWGSGTKFVDRGSWATYTQYCLQECDPEVENNNTLSTNTETAFAKHDDLSTCFLDIDEDGNGVPDFNRWGWTNGPLDPTVGTYEFNIYAGAGKCDVSKSTHVGVLYLSFDDPIDNYIHVSYNIFEEYGLKETHLYFGEEILPLDNNKFTVAPGQYLDLHENLNYANVDNYLLPYQDNGNGIYLVAHATVYV